MKRSMFIGIAACGLLFVLSISSMAQVLLNEVDVNPGGVDNPCEFVEIKGPANSIAENIYFASLEGDANSNPGALTEFVGFGSPGPAFGSSGLIVIVGTQACGTRTYPAGTLVVQNARFDINPGVLQNGTNSFLLISSPTALVAGTDYDTDNNGTLEGLPVGATIIDGVAWTDGGAGDITYGSAVLNAFGGLMGAATRFPSNNTPNLAAAWYGGSMTGTNDALTYNANIRTGNFPANGALTPGAVNVGVQPRDAVLDINGDGRTDFVMVRNTGGQLSWQTSFAGGNPFATRDWGLSTDVTLAGDYDGDGMDDITVFRPSNGTFYVVQSATLTMRIEQFGQSGDNPLVVGDYDGDGHDDLAVYRPGTVSTWFYKTSATSVFRSVEWGQTGDVPAAGDYDGDGKADFVVRRDEGASGRFWKRLSGGTFSTDQFGLAGDTVVPGDYDGDGKTDVAVYRNQGGVYVWDFEPSGTAGSAVVSDTWGVTGDAVTQGDYDGDGKTDYAVWRPGASGTFYMMTVGTRAITTKDWGVTGDVPVNR